MHTVWEARFFTLTFMIFIFICLLVTVLSVILFIKIHKAFVRCACVIAFAFSLIFMSFSLLSRYDEWCYSKNNQLIVEGKIENFISGNNGAESFIVNGTQFAYPISDSLIGYNITQRDYGSVIDGNGQYVRLYFYSRDGVNIIVKIDAYKTQNSKRLL